jgi:hypothetical protein
MAMHWQHAVRVKEFDSPEMNSKMVPAQVSEFTT